jgi:hypothetical protein
LVSVKAADLFDLDGGPNVGTSERWLLDVVTPEQLRGMLEARELVLRQRFERIVQEVVETRDLLSRVSFGTDKEKGDAKAGEKKTDKKADKTAAKAADEKAAGKKTGAEPGDKKDDKGKGAGAEPGDEPQDETKQLSPEQLQSMRLTRVQQALQNGRKNAQETLGVAESFDDIRKQLINNWPASTPDSDVEEWKMRVEERIAKPLHNISEKMFPEFEQRLLRLQEVIGDATSGTERRDLAQRQAEEILASMRQVLDQMLEMEDYNELVETLRSIIKAQDKVGEVTKERHKQKIRNLKED